MSEDTFTRHEILNLIWLNIGDVPGFDLNSQVARDTITDFFADKLTLLKENGHA